jgi:hypothetical protein
MSKDARVAQESINRQKGILLLDFTAAAINVLQRRRCGAADREELI